MWKQVEFDLQSRRRGFHLITGEILRNLPPLPEVGLLHLFIKHTSAGLSINENADPDVRMDMESIFNHLVKEREPYYQHTLEGNDDMPAHAKSSIIGTSVTIPITNGKLNLGTWQGIYLCEFRDYGGNRQMVATISGEYPQILRRQYCSILVSGLRNTKLPEGNSRRSSYIKRINTMHHRDTDYVISLSDRFM